jgi:hypothetical protein
VECIETLQRHGVRLNLKQNAAGSVAAFGMAISEPVLHVAALAGRFREVGRWAGGRVGAWVGGWVGR